MAQVVLLGNPAFFRVRSGANPHTRTRWGRRKQVHSERAALQWAHLKETLQQQGVRVRVIPPVREWPGLVFPANAGFRYGDAFYLSRLHPGRAGEIEHDRRAISDLGLRLMEFPAQVPFEGEADFTPVGEPSGQRVTYLFTFGRIERPRLSGRIGWPPYRRVYGFRSDSRALPALRQIVQPNEVIPLELMDEAHYCPFGPKREFLMVYLNGLAEPARAALRARFGNRLLLLGEEDGRAFAANSFQIRVSSQGEWKHLLLMPDGLTQDLYTQIRARGVIPCPVDVSEFLEKGGGAVKCMLLDLGDL
jgi:N-dimethylarginine dimethylaminohydrolase